MIKQRSEQHFVNVDRKCFEAKTVGQRLDGALKSLGSLEWEGIEHGGRREDEGGEGGERAYRQRAGAGLWNGEQEGGGWGEII